MFLSEWTSKEMPNARWWPAISLQRCYGGLRNANFINYNFLLAWWPIFGVASTASYVKYETADAP